VGRRVVDARRTWATRAPVIVFCIVLNRLLRHVYGEESRDLRAQLHGCDDKDHARAAGKRRPIAISPAETTQWFNWYDMAAPLARLEPDTLPRATAYILADGRDESKG